jgi:sec-independent protein translocase protein TatB
MFDFGFSELLIIAVVALVVLGPERLPKAARFVGVWVRRARAQWSSVKDELERDIASEELKRNLQEARDALHDTERSFRSHADDARTEFEQMRAAVASDSQPPLGNDPPRPPDEHEQLEDVLESSRHGNHYDDDQDQTYLEDGYAHEPGQADETAVPAAPGDADQGHAPAPQAHAPDSDDEPRRH